MERVTQEPDVKAKVAPTVVFNDPDVLADRAAVQAAIEAAQAARKADQDEAAALLAALESGKATDQQVRSALTYLLRRELGHDAGRNPAP